MEKIMNKELIDRTWSILPKEFKEEVKKRYLESASISDSLKYQYEKGITKNQYDLGVVNTYKNIFGIHNLTSDAEGEEMLTVPRKTVLEMFAANKRSKSAFAGTEIASESEQINHVLYSFFGSKCLPDNVDGLEQKSEVEDNIDLAKLNEQLDAALNSETKEYLEEWMEQDDDSNTRLQIAAQLLSGLLASGKEKHPVRRAFELTDALMAENKKR